MARVAYARRIKRVNTTSYPDDPSVPVGTTEWNADPESTGVLGFTKITATLDGNGVLSTKDDSATFTNESGASQAKQSTLIEVECNASSTTDAVVKVDITDTNENDIVYLFKGTDSDTVTVTHSGTLNANGQIQSLDGNSITVNGDGKPVCLMRRGNYWFEFGGGGSVNALNDIGDVTISGIASGELLKWNGSAFVNNTISEAGLASASHNHNTSDINAGTLTHERGGLEADVSAFNGLLKISGGSASQITDTLSGVTAGTVTASKAVVVDSSKDITGLNNVTVAGNLTVNGTTTTINSTTLSVDDKNIELGSVGTPSDTTADGGGITLKGATDKTLLWDDANNNWTSNQDWNIASGKSFKINNAVTLNATSLGSAVVGSSLTSVGTLTSLTVGGAVTLNAQNELRLADSDSSNYVVLKAGATIGTNYTITMPTAKGAVGEVLKINAESGGVQTMEWGSGGGGAHTVQEWTSQSSGTDPSITAGTNAKMYVKYVDANNDGLFIKIKKNASATVVQIA